MAQTLANKIYHQCIDALPQNRTFDYLISLLIFVRSHKRMPKVEGGLYNDSLFFLKTTDAILDPLRVYVSDKEFVKDFVASVVGGIYNVPTLGVVHSLQEALNYDFPKNCVIKPTHMSGPVMFRRDESEIDYGLFKEWFSSNYYLWGREANYRHLKPKLIIEPYIFNRSELEDYKVLCVNGVPRIIQVDGTRHTRHTISFYTTDWRELPFSALLPKGAPIARPENLEEMLEVAASLSKDFSLIRVDLYSDGKSVLVGELTNCPGNARMPFSQENGERMMTQILFGSTGFAEYFSDANLRQKSA